MGIFSWTVLSAICLLLPHLAFAQVRVGQLAPSLTSAEVIQGDLQPAEHGNPVLLEFWATWCGPCIENIPHINAMAKQFQHAGLRVISLTSENAATVKSFLKTHPIEGIVAQDPDQRLLQQFGAGTPTTVLIDRSNRIVRKVHPAQITPKALEDLVLDRPVQIAAIRDDMYPAQGGGAFHESESDASTIVKAVVRPSNKIGGLVPISNSAKDSTHELVKADGTRCHLCWRSLTIYDQNN